MLIARDITHRKQIEEELAASRAQLETTLDTMISGIGIVGLSGEIVRANPSARALFGIVGEQDFPKHMLDLQNKVEFAWPDGRPLTPEEWPVLRSVRGEIIPYLEVRVRIHATGETKLVSYRSAPVRDPRGIITHAVINIEDITSRKAAEDALRKSEERYRQYIELVPAAVWRWDYPSPIPLDLPEMELAQRLTKEGRVGECNLVYARQKGYASPEEMEGRSILETGTGSFGDHINRALLFFRQGCRIADMEYVDDSGETVRHYLGSLVGVVADGCLKSIWGTRRDITERKLAEQALARSEERLRVILESASLGTWTYCPAAGIFDADPQTKLLHGLTADAPHGKRLLDAIHPDDRARVSALLERQNCDGAAFCEEVRAVLPDGSLRWLAYNGRYVADPVDGVRQWLGVVSDVTARKSAEEELRENQLRFSMLAEAVPDILITSAGDPDNLTCDYINQRAAEYTGMPLSVLREPAGWSAAFHPEDLAPFLKAIMASLETGTPLMHEVRARRADGVYRWHRMQFVPMWNAEGKVVKWFGVCADIDDLKRMGHELEQKRSELEEYNRELAESNRDLQQFAAVVAHDLQSPLSAISMTIEQVEQLSQERHDQDSVEYSKLIMASVNRMRLLIRKVFDYSRLDSNAAPFVPVDCNDGLRQTLALLALDIASSGAVVTADSLPVVLGDLCQIEQVFQNLIGNAVKYKRADTPVRIHVSAERRHDAWVFSVADNGIGIPAGDAQRIFKPFEKLRPASEGAGIGLAICQRVIERHGGRIWVESEPGAGSKFYFTIPVSRAIATVSR